MGRRGSLEEAPLFWDGIVILNEIASEVAIIKLRGSPSGLDFALEVTQVVDRGVGVALRGGGKLAVDSAGSGVHVDGHVFRSFAREVGLTCPTAQHIPEVGGDADDAREQGRHA